jgi:hypothetical protein
MLHAVSAVWGSGALYNITEEIVFYSIYSTSFKKPA